MAAMSKKSIGKENFALGKENYILLVIGFAIIVLGFILMIGGKSEDPTVSGRWANIKRQKTILTSKSNMVKKV